VLFLALLTACVVLIVWQSSRIVQNAACPLSALPRLSTQSQQVLPSEETDDAGFERESIELPLQWDERPLTAVSNTPQEAPAKTATNTSVEPTKILLHAAGNTVFTNLYIFDGALHIVTDNRQLPELKRITSNGVSLNLGNSDPTDEDIRVPTVRDAERTFGGRAVPLEGTSWMVTEHPEFIAHYYHYTAEILLSLQRTTSALNLTLPPPARLFFPHSTHAAFRDGPGMNAYISLAAFSSSAVLFSDTWADLRASKRAYKLERAVLFDRAGAMGGPAHGRSWKPISEAMSLPAKEADWWGEVRERVVDFAGGELLKPGRVDGRKRVVTYVSRQGGNRRALREADHIALVTALQAASEELRFELNVVQLEGMTKEEQIQLAARTTILMGVHGNGLTSLVWMRPTPHSAVFEFFMPGGWFRDYEITARSLGIMYRGFWNDTSFSYPGFQGRDVNGFHSAQIPLHAAYVVDQVKKALQRGLGEHILNGA